LWVTSRQRQRLPQRATVHLHGQQTTSPRHTRTRHDTTTNIKPAFLNSDSFFTAQDLLSQNNKSCSFLVLPSFQKRIVSSHALTSAIDSREYLPTLTLPLPTSTTIRRRHLHLPLPTTHLVTLSTIYHPPFITYLHCIALHYTTLQHSQPSSS
jgi:hypothetical protein